MRPAPSPSYSWQSSIPLPAVSSTARPGRAATPPGSARPTIARARNGWSCSRRSRPRLRVAVLYHPRNPGGLPMFTAIQVMAPMPRVELSPAAVRDAAEIERAVAALASSPNGGLIMTRTTEVMAHHDLIVGLAARHRLPTIYPLRAFVKRGGLISYGNEVVTDYRLAAGYVDRILKGEKAADLPVQAPVKFELAVNLKTAKALGLTVPDKLPALADEVIE